MTFPLPAAAEATAITLRQWPVVNQNLKVAIFVDGTSINLINGSTPIELGKTYVAKLYSDENKKRQV